jgi:hypothetical protein
VWNIHSQLHSGLKPGQDLSTMSLWNHLLNS